MLSHDDEYHSHLRTLGISIARLSKYVSGSVDNEGVSKELINILGALSEPWSEADWAVAKIVMDRPEARAAFVGASRSYSHHHQLAQSWLTPTQIDECT